MKRRHFLRTASVAPLLTLSPFPIVLPGARRPEQNAAGGLFFDSSDLPRIKDNSRTPFLKDYVNTCLNADIEADRAVLRDVPDNRNLFTTLRRALPILQRESLAYLITGERERVPFIHECVDLFLSLPEWEYFLASGRRLGLQLAPKAIITLLFARDVLGEKTGKAREARLLSQVADLGCVPCFNSVWDMDNKASIRDWTFDPKYSFRYEIDMRRWPIILDRTNLKAIPVAGLGLGALALRGKDSRAEGWLKLAEKSAIEFLELVSEDGSYFEGLSYADYSFQNLFIFFEAHRRLLGTIDWFDYANFYGFSEYMVFMQLGRTADGSLPDIVNFSDARRSFTPSVAMWVANRGDDGLAQYAATQFSQGNRFTDVLWYEPGREASRPASRLKNVRSALDWIICRTGWDADDSMLAFRSGTPANHEHADRNSFIFKAKGERLLTDPFGADYDWRKPGWILRLTGAHNSVLIDGKGHQYHKGEEGTNSSQSEARILRFVDREDTVWWTSDASQAYGLVNRNVEHVLRSMLFLKPDILLILDDVRLHQHPASIAVRFHPDNRDGKAEVTAGQSAIRIQRPRASLSGRFAATTAVESSVRKLDLPESNGVFPFAQLETPAVLHSKILSVFAVNSASSRSEAVSIRNASEQSWVIEAAGRRIRLDATGRLPEFDVQAGK